MDRGWEVAVVRQPRPQLFGLSVDALTMEETIAAVRDYVSSADGPRQHVSVNAAKVVAATNDARLAEIINGCDLVSADGASVVWASRVLGMPLPRARCRDRSLRATRGSRCHGR